MRKNRISWLSLGYGILLLVFVLVNRAVAYREVSRAAGECLRTLVFSAALFLSSVRECINRNYLWAVSGIGLAVALPLMAYLDMDTTVLFIPLILLFLLSMRTVQISLSGNVSAVEVWYTKYGASQQVRPQYMISQDKAAYSRLLDVIGRCTYLKDICRKSVRNPGSPGMQPDAYTMGFVEDHEGGGRRTVLTYTIHSDGQIEINHKRVRCSPLSMVSGKSIYDSVRQIVEDPYAPESPGIR